MVQGGLSETTRRCGNRNCICHRDPAKRHGPHLYLTYRSEAKAALCMYRTNMPSRLAKHKQLGKSFGTWRVHWPPRTVNNCANTCRSKRPRPSEGQPMVELRHHQRLVWEGWFPEQAEGWWEEWMRQADQVLDDDELLEAVYHAQGKRRPKSRCRGRKQTPAEALLRLAVLKHVRNWSFEDIEREVRANVVYRQLLHAWSGKSAGCQDAGDGSVQAWPRVIDEVHQRLWRIAQEKKVVRNADCGWTRRSWKQTFTTQPIARLLSDGARVLTRTDEEITALERGGAGEKLATACERSHIG